MFGRKTQEAAFEHEVLLEMEFLRKLHGDDAVRVAGEKAGRPENRTRRRLVLEEVARRGAAAETRPARTAPGRLGPMP